MNAIKFLLAAYVATWVIHGAYLGTLVRRFARLRRELRELGEKQVDQRKYEGPVRQRTPLR